MLPPNATAATVSAYASTVLYNLRRAFNEAAELQAWVSAQSDADLNSLFPDANYVAALKSAAADAGAEAQIHNTGLPPNTYPQPTAAYIYGASQRLIIGPQ